MRFDHLFQLLQRRGFFLGTQLIRYDISNPKPLVYTFGVGSYLVNFVRILLEHPVSTSRRLPNNLNFGGLERQRSLGSLLLTYTYPHLGVLSVYIWRLAYYVKTSHYKAYRYILGLPARGQRTHSNAKTVRYFRGEHVTQASSLLGIRLFSWNRVAVDAAKKKRAKGKQASLKKTTKSAKVAVRSKKKKLDVWR